MNDWVPLDPSSQPQSVTKYSALKPQQVSFTPQEQQADIQDSQSESSRQQLLAEVNRKGLAPGQRNILKQEYERNFGEAPQIIAQNDNRGAQISAELKGNWVDVPERSTGNSLTSQSSHWVDVEDEQPQPQAQPKHQGFIGKIFEAAKTGAVDSLKDLQSSGDAIMKGEGGHAASTSDYAKPLEWGDVLHPSVAAPKAIYQLAHGAPMLAGGIAGGIAGEAVAPEAGPIAPIIGGSLGAAAMSSAQAIGPYYSAALQETNDPDKAFDMAIKKASVDGAFTAAGWAAFSFSPFQGAVKNLLTQAFGVQPAITAGQTATQNVMDGKPAGEGVAESIPGAVVGTLLPAAGHAAIKAIGGEKSPVQSEAAPTEEAPQQPPLGLGHQAGEPLVTFPDGSTMTRAEAEQERANGITHQPADQAGGESVPHETLPPLSPIEQARVDVNALKEGQPITDDTRLRNATLVSVYGENSAVRHVIESGELSSLGDAMLMIAPKVEQVRQTLKNGQQSRDITSDIMTATDELVRMKAEGKTVDEVMAGLPHEVSFEGQQLLRFLDENQQNTQKIAQFMENYLQIVEDMGGVPSNVRGKAFDIMFERQMAKKEAEKSQAFSEKEGQEAEQKKTETQLSMEQARAENALTEMAKARAAGQGINPEHQTAMEVAFQNAKQLKEKNSEPSSTSNERVRQTETSSTKTKPAEGNGNAKTREGRVPDDNQVGESGNARSIRENGDTSRAEADNGRVGRAADIKIESIPKEQLKDIPVKTRAIDAETGKRVMVKDKADVVLKDLDHQIATMKALMECLG